MLYRFASFVDEFRIASDITVCKENNAIRYNDVLRRGVCLPSDKIIQKLTGMAFEWIQLFQMKKFY